MDDRYNSVEAMRASVFFDGEHASARYSRFWLLLILAAVIASAGVVADSTATVIGAMIVAPLMTPILGTMLATVLGDRANLVRSLLLVLGGAAAALAIGYLVGLLVAADVLAGSNPQVAGRVTPRLIDLLAALGTGVVGSIALVRKDISDTLPGVAIAISLVPPLTVAGLALESGSVTQSLGALLLFATNVVAIIGTGIAVMSVYGVSRLARGGSQGQARRSGLRRPVILVSVMLVVVGIPLTLSSASIARSALTESAAYDVAEPWARSVGWEVESVSTRGSDVIVRLYGALPVPDTDVLEDRLDAAGVDSSAVTVYLTPEYVVRFDGGG